MGGTQETATEKPVKLVFKQLTRVAQFFGAASIVLMLLISALAAIQRYVFHTSAAWVDEVEQYLLLLTVFIVCGSAYTEGEHVRADMALRRLPPRARQIAVAATDIIGIGFCSFMLWQGVSQVIQLKAANLRSGTSLQTPLYVVALLLPLSMLLLGIAFAYHLAYAGRFVKSRDEADVKHDGTAPH